MITKEDIELQVRFTYIRMLGSPNVSINASLETAVQPAEAFL